MAIIDRHDRPTDSPDPRWWVRMAWLVAIWVASVASLGIVAWAIRSWLK